MLKYSIIFETLGVKMGNKSLRESSEQRNKILKEILETISESKDGKKISKAEINSIVTSILAVIISFTSILITIWIHKNEAFNESLVLSSEISIQIDNNYEDSYIIEFDIKQGGIKKAYIAMTSSDGSIAYESILQSSSGSAIKLVRNSGKSKEDIQTNTGKIIGDGIVEINSIKNFALIILDTTEQWWIYYFISTPEFVPKNSSYMLTVYGENGDVIASLNRELEIQKMSRIIIDCSLISVSSIEEAMKDLKVDYYFFNMPQDFEGVNGEIFTSNPRMENLYELPSATDIYSNIIKIREDIKKMSF